MNHLFHQISWHQYLCAAFIAAIIYYLVVTLRYYRPALQKLQHHINGNKSNDPLEVLQYKPAEVEALSASVQSAGEYAYPGEIISNVDILTGELKACIAKAAGKPFAPAELIPQLKQILRDYQPIAATDRSVVNHMLVNACEKTGTALLTEEEVDQWWES
jgi:hypothetical protein